MFDASRIRKLDEHRYIIPKESRSDMRTNAVIYASERLMAAIRKDLSLEQAVNVATLPGIVGDSLAMPDIHQGYGFPIGGVAATDYRKGVVSPGGVGFDINCGVRLLVTSLTREEVVPRLRDLILQLFRDIPCGIGREGAVPVDSEGLDSLLSRGAEWVVERGYGEPLQRCAILAGLHIPQLDRCIFGATCQSFSVGSKHNIADGCRVSLQCGK